MTLPFLLSVPHAGLRVPPEAEPFCKLKVQEIVEDGDEGAAEIYDLASEVEALVTTDIARAIVDLNRAEDDRRRDGVVKTHTCWNVPVYSEPPSGSLIKALLENHYYPYHERLGDLGRVGSSRLGIDCHTMAAKGPPVGPDPGKERPWICLSNADGTCPQRWVEVLKACFEELVDGPVRVNDPFRGGYITNRHSTEMPWLQLEMSRGPFMSNGEKRQIVLDAFARWAEVMECQ